MRFNIRKYKVLWLITDATRLVKGRKSVIGEFGTREVAALLAALLELRPWLMDETVNMGWASEDAAQTGTESVSHHRFTYVEGKFRRIMDFCNVTGWPLVAMNLTSEHWSMLIANKVPLGETISLDIDMSVDLKHALSEVI